MRELEQLLGLFLAAVLLAGAARRIGAPYPVFVALGGALLLSVLRKYSCRIDFG